MRTNFVKQKGLYCKEEGSFDTQRVKRRKIREKEKEEE